MGDGDAISGRGVIIPLGAVNVGDKVESVGLGVAPVNVGEDDDMGWTGAIVVGPSVEVFVGNDVGWGFSPDCVGEDVAGARVGAAVGLIVDKGKTGAGVGEAVGSIRERKARTNKIENISNKGPKKGNKKVLWSPYLV